MKCNFLAQTDWRFDLNFIWRNSFKLFFIQFLINLFLAGGLLDQQCVGGANLIEPTSYCQVEPAELGLS